MVEFDRPTKWCFPTCCGTCGQWLSDMIVLPCALLALSMKLFVNYLVCVDSLSIILSADTAHDIIFNGLAITFVSDLGEDWWKFLEHALHFESIENVKFERSPSGEVWEDDATLTKDGKERAMCPSLLSALSNCTSLPKDDKDGSAKRASIFSIGYGGNRIMHVLAMIALMGIYGRQLLVMLHAFDTGKLPAARDLCSEYRLMRDLESTTAKRTWGSETMNVLEEHFLHDLLGSDKQMAKFDNKTNPLHNECVKEGKLDRLSVCAQIQLVKKHIKLVCAFALAGLFLLVIPKLMRCIADAHQKRASNPVTGEPEMPLLRDNGSPSQRTSGADDNA